MQEGIVVVDQASFLGASELHGASTWKLSRSSCRPMQGGTGQRQRGPDTQPHLDYCGWVVKALRLHIQVLAITSSGHANFASGARSRKEDFAASTSPVIDCGKAVADLRFALAQSDHRSASTCSRRLFDPLKRHLAISEKPSATRSVLVSSGIDPVKRHGGHEAKSTRCIDLCRGANAVLEEG